MKLDLADLEEYVKLIKLEQDFRVRLHLYKEMKEHELQTVKELKSIGEKLSRLKQRFKGHKDKDLDVKLRVVLNSSFIGGVLKQHEKVSKLGGAK